MSQTAEALRRSFVEGREPDSDEPEMESSLHYDQLALLVSTLEWHWRGRDDFFVGANLSVYFRRDQSSRRELRGPDFFVVRDVERRPRRSWTVWLEGGRYPDLIIELLSDETARTDRTLKKTLYETVFRTPEYFWFSPETGELCGFGLVEGHYRRIAADARGHLPSGVLGLALGVLDGLLRFYDDTGALVPTLQEAVLRERALFEQERALFEQEQARADRLAAQLRALGVDPAP
ncbi:Uma2 family endonuclease [uncultured Thiodictyon sp.]|uniref:Uma2 family endonuclease n=1 Tax=uncultured Thiodictyon sp. TaxID=1846217 RepID=UPI0025EBEC73|nr:Uma2 family endonuclease [uncultured Thiodictyon sp.]